MEMKYESGMPVRSVTATAATKTSFVYSRSNFPWLLDHIKRVFLKLNSSEVLEHRPDALSVIQPTPSVIVKEVRRVKTIQLFAVLNCQGVLEVEPP